MKTLNDYKVVLDELDKDLNGNFLSFVIMETKKPYLYNYKYGCCIEALFEYYIQTKDIPYLSFKEKVFLANHDIINKANDFLLELNINEMKHINDKNTTIYSCKDRCLLNAIKINYKVEKMLDFLIENKEKLTPLKNTSLEELIEEKILYKI